MQMTQKDALLMQLGLFYRALAVMMGKRKDYSGDNDPFANLRMSAMAGVEPWRGVQVRNFDKFSRRRHMMEHEGKAHIKDESFLDTAADSLNYVAIELGLELEELGDKGGEEMLAELAEDAYSLSYLVEEYIKEVPHA